MSLTITPNAALAIRRLMSDREGGGLRISPVPNEDNGSEFELKLALTEHPQSTDEVITEHGSVVFVEERLSPVLADKTLDIGNSEEGQVTFRLVS